MPSDILMMKLLFGRVMSCGLLGHSGLVSMMLWCMTVNCIALADKETSKQGCSKQSALQEQDLPCMYPTHHELESVLIVTVVVLHCKPRVLQLCMANTYGTDRMDWCCIAGSILFLQLCAANSSGNVPSVCFKTCSASSQHSIHHQARGRSPHTSIPHCNAHSHCVLALLLCNQCNHAFAAWNQCPSAHEGQAGSRCGSGCF